MAMGARPSKPNWTSPRTWQSTARATFTLPMLSTAAFAGSTPRELSSPSPEGGTFLAMGARPSRLGWTTPRAWRSTARATSTLPISAANRIRRVDPSGMIATVAGTGERGFAGDGGAAVEALLANPTDVAVDEAGNLYISPMPTTAAFAGWTSRAPSPQIAGTGERGFAGDGGAAVKAQLADPLGVAVDRAGNLYIADAYNYRIRRVDLSGTIATIAGTGERGFGRRRRHGRCRTTGPSHRRRGGRERATSTSPMPTATAFSN